MGEPTCSIDGCDRPVHARGWCHAHFERWRKTGDVDAATPVAPRFPSDGTCSVAGCGKPVQGRGWCATHYMRWRRHGSPDLPERQQSDCSVDGCERLVKALGYCMKHYTRFRIHGDPLIVHAPPVECSVEGCEKKPRHGGLCPMHASRLIRHGDPLGMAATLPNSEVNYHVLHTRLRKERGSARNHQCIACGRPASTWAQIHGADPCGFDSYVPMCRSCHAKYDTYPETREKWRRGVEEYWTPERRAEWSARMRQLKAKGEDGRHAVTG